MTATPDDTVPEMIGTQNGTVVRYWRDRALAAEAGLLRHPADRAVIDAAKEIADAYAEHEQFWACDINSLCDAVDAYPLLGGDT